MPLSSWIDSLRQDLKYALRQFRLNPGFSAIAVLSLALGTGANTAIFQLVDAVRLRTLPVKDPQELTYVDFAKGAERDGNFSTRSSMFTYRQWDLIRRQQQAFSGMAAWSATRFDLTSGGVERFAEGLYVNGDFFRVLGVPALRGRTFTGDDDQPGCGSPGAVISEPFWRREMGGDPNVLNSTVRLDGRPFPIVGVTPAAFFGVEVGHRYDVAIPICADHLYADNGKGRAAGLTSWWISMIGRLKPGWSAQRANAHLLALSPSIMQASLPPTYRPQQAKKYLANKLEAMEGGTGVSNLRRQFQTPLYILLATTGLVLLIACANLANLLLARASVRQREIAVRQAIGAGRGRLITQLLAESALLAIAGTALGALIAQALSRALIAFLSTPDNPTFVGLGIDFRMLGFTAGLAIAACLLFGLVPALRATRIAPASVMRASGRGLTAGRERFSLRRALVVAQVALSMVLLVGALLFVRSLRNVLAVDAGFRPQGLVAVDLDLRRPQYSKERLPVVYRDLLDRLGSRPGVVSAAQVNILPISGSGWNNQVFAEGSTASPKLSLFNSVGSGYFRTMGSQLIAGRDFDARDRVGAPKVAIVNQMFAQKIFGGGNPLGRRFHVPGDAGKPDNVYQVVGMVRNSKYYDLREDFDSIAYFPITQDDDPGPGVTYVMRTNAPLGDIFASAKAAVAEVHPEIGVQFHVMTAMIDDSLLRDRLMATLSGAFGFLAALLATLGLYGVIAYMVAQRRNEIGVRMALGADRGRVVMLVVREAGLLVSAGIVVGTGAALWAGQAAAAMLFGLKPYDPVTLAFAIALLGGVALIATYGPARRAARLDPMAALRED